jgi:hypothetical protein
MLVTVCAFLPACQKSRTPNPGAAADTPEALAQMWLDVLASGDFENPYNCLVRAEDIPEVEDAWRADGTSEAQIALYREGIQTHVTELPATFQSMIDHLTAQGIDLTQARIVSVTVEEVNALGGMPIAMVFFTFSAEGKTYMFDLDYCAKLQRGWVTAGPEFLGLVE